MNTGKGKIGVEPCAGLWDFDGVCVPGRWGSTMQQTFSVGVFQWVPMRRGKEVKRSKAVARVSGFVTDEAKIYAKARELCEALQRGETLPKKSYRV